MTNMAANFGVKSLRMTQKLILLFLLSSLSCAGQSVLTTPSESTQSDADTSTAPATGATPQTTLQVPRLQGVRPNSENGVPANVNNGNTPTQGRTPTESRIVGPLREKSEFERFAEDATGHRLPVYGRKLFDEVPTTFAPLESVPVPAGYVIGPGDELLIRVWGKIDLDSRVTVDRNGQISIPKVGTLTVAGLRYEQVEGYLHSAISAMFKDFQLNVTLGQLRSIQIYVLGNARQPGAYTVSSLSTLVNALFVSGGPSATGSMRHIQLRRGGVVITDFDIYDLAQKGDKYHDVQLLPGDVIYIPPVGPQVALTGDVDVPGIYELRGETTVSMILEGAGGLTSLAEADRVLLERIEHHSNRHVEEFALNDAGLKRVLSDGDLLRIYPLSPKFDNAVTLRGNVAQSGRYVWKEGMRISDLIPSRDFLVTRDYWNTQNNLVPRNPARQFANPRYDKYDRQAEGKYGDQPIDTYGNIHAGEQNNTADVELGDIQSSDLQTNQPDEQIPDRVERSRTEESRSSDSDPLGSSRTRMIDSIGKNSAEINWEYAVIERLDNHDLSTRLIPFRLISAIDEPSSADNQLLKAGDVITIFSRADLDLPMEKHASFVRVGGEVNAPGVYRVNPGESLREVVEQAGGLTPHAYLYASKLTRVSARRAEEEQLKLSTEQMQRELTAQFANSTPQAGQTAADQQAQLAMQQASLARLSAIKPTGRVVLEMKPEAAVLADLPDFPLEDGDTFYVPPRLSTIQVAGSVYNANAFRYEKGERLISYLNNAGGATREADKKRIFVIRADGTVVSSQTHSSYSHGSFEKMKLLPGDAIIVPEKIRVASRMAEFAQATQFVSQAALTAAALSVVK